MMQMKLALLPPILLRYILAGNSRSDIAYATNAAARFTSSPKQSHCEALKRIGRYLKGTRDKGITFKPEGELKLEAFADADFAGMWKIENKQSTNSVKSRTGYTIMFAGCPVVWVSKLQTEIALSTLEAEYIALSQCMRDLIPIQRILLEISEMFELKLEQTVTKSTLFEDNEGALHLATTPKMTPRTKHIGIKYHFFRNEVQKGRRLFLKW